MNDFGHQAIVSLAGQALDEAPWVPDAEAMLDTCMLPDRIAIPLLQGHTGPWRVYLPEVVPPFNFERGGRTARSVFPTTDFYTEQVIACLQRGDEAEAARFAGVFSHFLGDFTQPAHYYELDIGRLLPPPPSMRNCNYHTIIENIEGPVAPMRYVPKLLGLTPAETVFRLEGRLTGLHARSVAAVLPMLRAIYRRRLEQAWRVLERMIRATAELFADFCYTAGCIVRQTFDPREMARLRRCDLRTVEPASFDVEFNFGYHPLRDVITIANYGYAQPFILALPGGAIRRVRGLCPIPHALPLEGIELGSTISYALPPGVYTRFTVFAGLLAGEPRQAPCVFEVLTDGILRCRSPFLHPGDPAVPLDVDISACRTLDLHVLTDGSTDKLAYPIWGEPTLSKRSHFTG